MPELFTGVALITNAGCGQFCEVIIKDLLSVDIDLGEAVALGLVRAGCRRIALADYELDRLSQIREKMRSYANDAKILLVAVDSNDSESFERMARTTTEYFEEINYCINCSTSAVPSRPTADLDADMFLIGLNRTSRAVRMSGADSSQALMNFVQLWLCLRAELRQILAQSKDFKANSIVNIIPYGDRGVHNGQAVLAASSYSRIGMMKSMARDHINDGVRINAVCPALTNSQEDAVGESKVLKSHMRIPSRLIEVDEVAHAAIFMAGELSSGIHGVALPVDCGWSMVHN